MFGLFKKKDQSAQLTHYVYLNKASKLRMLMQEASNTLNAEYKVLLIYHFDETGNILEELVRSVEGTTDPNNKKIITIKSDQLSQKIHEVDLDQFSALVAELHPMPGKDEIVQETIHQTHPGTRVVFYTSTDGPLMKAFGGEKIHNMMVALGLSENERVQHKMVSKSIANAQEKIKAKVQFEKPAHSKQQWMDLNVKSGS